MWKSRTWAQTKHTSLRQQWKKNLNNFSFTFNLIFFLFCMIYTICYCIGTAYIYGMHRIGLNLIELNWTRASIPTNFHLWKYLQMYFDWCFVFYSWKWKIPRNVDSSFPQQFKLLHITWNIRSSHLIFSKIPQNLKLMVETYVFCIYKYIHTWIVYTSKPILN